MIDLRALAALVAEHGDRLDDPVATLRVGGRDLDTDARPALMGVLNLSQDSWYRESVVAGREDAVRRGRVMQIQGADVIDVGAESVQSHAARVEADAQTEQLVPVVEGLVEAGVPVSVESYHPSTVEACLRAGASVVNLTGSGTDEEMFGLAGQYGATVVLCHVVGTHARDLADAASADVRADPLPAMLEQFERRLAHARELGVPSLAVDPGIGFGFGWISDRRERFRYQSTVLLHAFRLRTLGVPVCNVLPAAMDLFADEVRTAEGFFSVLAHLGRTGLYRTHEVPKVKAVLDAMHELPVFPEAGE
ncbi:dihydropteroate synthase [Nocardioides acrostichi]|uniref:Dihydropteroate synthase n=1 Tax=Nocardioides acrostichi TaxID=2784339 RepID=A0A930UV17_9ACTN|nr:dihydropteroate synthase [Nocardioides acrostichi]MBF4161373.1 dihydropteroate synthase [Nocardioides acrostichi]